MSSKTDSIDAEGVLYNSERLVGCDVGGVWFSPERMLRVMVIYDKCVREGKFDRVERIENLGGFPRTWLNGVISEVVRYGNGKGLAERLMKRFDKRGYDKDWLKRNRRKVRYKSDKYGREIC